ncbi:hypothetical protein L6452_09264 [Arctium lappa]|uniref:Uncharacterized protein n=1 Tax=Arctium lappa TaxID=4217 RepID=A0ACB9DKE1_ARCLA|nr:hypothetical protein L6452_09264 [Arctium lappa]
MLPSSKSTHASFFQGHYLLASKATIPFQSKNIASKMQGVWDVISLLLSSLKNITSNIQVAKNLGFFRVEKEFRRLSNSNNNNNNCIFSLQTSSH